MSSKILLPRHADESKLRTLRVREDYKFLESTQNVWLCETLES